MLSQGTQVSRDKCVHAVSQQSVVKVNQYNLKAAREVFRKKLLEEGGPLALIATCPCALKYKKKHLTYYVDPEACIACRTCVGVGCPPIGMHAYPGMDPAAVKSYIDPTRCVGCSVCYQVCPVGAIKRSKAGEDPPVARPVDVGSVEEES